MHFILKEYLVYDKRKTQKEHCFCIKTELEIRIKSNFISFQITATLKFLATLFLDDE